MVGLGIGLGMFPVLNWLARMGGAEDDGPGAGKLSALVWCGVAVQLGLYMLTYMSYGSFSCFLSFNPNSVSLITSSSSQHVCSCTSHILLPTVSS